MDAAPAKRSAAPYGVLLALFVAAYLWKLSGRLPVEPISSHVSNFAITGAVLTLLCTPRAFSDPGGRRRALLLCALFAAVNLVVEILMGIGGFDRVVNRLTDGFNTADPLDGVAGLAAVGVVLAALPRRHVPEAGDAPAPTSS